MSLREPGRLALAVQTESHGKLGRPQLAAWTNWWLHSRDDDGDGICQYHHGNDSGWDNATCFAVDMPVERFAAGRH